MVEINKNTLGNNYSLIQIRKVSLKNKKENFPGQSLYFNKGGDEPYIKAIIKESLSVENYNFEFQVYQETIEAGKVKKQISFSIYGGDVSECLYDLTYAQVKFESIILWPNGYEKKYCHKTEYEIDCFLFQEKQLIVHGETVVAKKRMLIENRVEYEVSYVWEGN